LRIGSTIQRARSKTILSPSKKQFECETNNIIEHMADDLWSPQT